MPINPGAESPTDYYESVQQMLSLVAEAVDEQHGLKGFVRYSRKKIAGGVAFNKQFDHMSRELYPEYGDDDVDERPTSKQTIATYGLQVGHITGLEVVGLDHMPPVLTRVDTVANPSARAEITPLDLDLYISTIGLRARQVVGDDLWRVFERDHIITDSYSGEIFADTAGFMLECWRFAAEGGRAIHQAFDDMTGASQRKFNKKMLGEIDPEDFEID